MFFDRTRVRRKLDGKLGWLRKIFDGNLWFIEHDDETVSAVYTDQLELHWELSDEPAPKSVDEQSEGNDVHGC